MISPHIETKLKRSLALTLRVFDYSETSQIVHLYSRELGKIHCIAKGSKRKKSAFHGAFDILTLYDVQRFEKQPGTLDLLTAAEAIQDYRGIRDDFRRFTAASYAVDLVDEFTPEAVPQPEVFETLRELLESLNGGAAIPETLFRFEAKLLERMGHFPRIDECGRCGRPPSGSEVWFSVRDGGVLCLQDPPKDSMRFVVKRVALDGLKAFQQGRSFNVSIYPNFVDDLRRLLDTHIRCVLDREPKSMRFLKDVFEVTAARR